MGYLIDKIRSWFCKHEWELLVNGQSAYLSPLSKYPDYHQWIYVCKKNVNV